MKLAFALMAAINGFTGSCATLSHGLWLPHQASPASARRQKVLTLHGRGRKRPPFRSGSRCGSPLTSGALPRSARSSRGELDQRLVGIAAAPG